MILTLLGPEEVSLNAAEFRAQELHLEVIMKYSVAGGTAGTVLTGGLMSSPWLCCSVSSALLFLESM